MGKTKKSTKHKYINFIRIQKQKMKNKDSNVHKSEALEIGQLNKQTLTLKVSAI